MVTTAAYLDAIRRYGSALVRSCGLVQPDTPVPTCPGWTVDVLAAHTAAVYQHKAELVRDGWVTESPPSRKDTEALRGDAAIDALALALDEIVGVFEQTDLSVPAYTWCDHDHEASWWVRRMAHESMVHAADGVIAAGGRPIGDDWLAIDGVDEILDEMLVGAPEWATLDHGNDRIDLVSAGRRWSLRTASFSGTGPTSGTEFDREPTVVYDTEGIADAVIETDPVTLDLWMWGRAELPDGSVTGDAALARWLRTVAAEST